jgi:hypothetical protein
MYYTYLHLNENNKPIYVGKGKGNRAYEKRNYLEPYTVKIVHDNISEAQALEFEEFLIQEISIDKLYNKRTKGNISGYSICIDYNNIKKELRRLSTLPVSLKRKHAQLLINDVIAGNDKAIRMFVKCSPKKLLLQINQLIQSYSDKF